MKSPRRAILSASVWAALAASAVAQLELKREPLPPAQRLVPAAPVGNAQGPAIQRRLDRVIQGDVIINEGVFGNGAIFINGVNVGNEVVSGFGNGEPVKFQPDPAGPQVLEFTDDRRLHGTLATLDAARGRLVWLRPDASEPLTIPFEQVTRWSSENPPSTEPAPAGPAATVKFSGSDWLVANGTTMQGDKVQLQLPSGSRLAAERAHVEWIYFSPSGGAETYDGPTSLAGWNSTGGGWTYREGALYASSPSPISRNFDALPDRVEYHLVVNQGDLAAKSFTISLHARTAQTRIQRRGSVQLILRGTNLNLWASVEGKFVSLQADIGNQLGSASRTKEPIAFRIFEDIATGRLLVHINGRKAAEWTIDKGEPGKNGGAFQFQPTSWSSEKEQSISRIRILPWDGVDPGEENERTRDSVLLSSGEVKRGKFTGWDGKALKMSTERGAITVPVSQIELLRFQRPANPPDEEAPVARLRLTSRGEFDVVGLDWRDGKFQVRTNFGGQMTLPIPAIADLGFNRLPSTPQAGNDLLVFRSGDRLRGTLEAADEKGKIRWKPNPAGPAIDFAPANIAGLQFAPAAINAPPASVNTVARFRNGDWLAGAFVTLDGEQVVLDTGEVGQVTAARSGVKALYFNADGAPAVSDGASDHETWERGLDLSPGNSALRKKLAEAGNPWSYFAGAYTRVRPGSNDTAYNRVGGIQLGRIFETMPARVEFALTITSERVPVFFSMQLFSEPSNPGYMVHVSAGVISLYDTNPRPRGRGINQQQFPFPKEIKPTARERRLRVFADRTSGQFAIYVDGVLTAQVTPKAADGPRNLGRGIMITPNATMAPIISNLWVSPWNGILPAKAPAQQPAPETVGLANGDDVQGKVELATPSTMKITSEVGPLDLPMERLTMVDFGGQPIEPSPAIRLQFAGRGSLTLTAWRLEKDVLICQSPVVGELKVPWKAVQELVFAPPEANSAPE